MAIRTYFASSVGRKQVMALTGLGLSLFILTHMAANLLAIFSADAYNNYSHALISNPLIYVAEGGLVAIFLIHIYLAIRLTLENRRARHSRYAVSPNGGRGGTTLGARSMFLSGLLLFVFVVFHLKTFKFGAYYSTTVNGVEMRDLHQLLLEVFRDPGYVGWYIFSMLVLGLHLSHGLQSTFQSFGLNHPNINCCLRRSGYVFAILVTLGFMSVPLFVYLKG